MVTTSAASSQRVILPNISWQTFETILAEMGNNRATRLAYDCGTLEIMTPLMPHEHNKRLIEKLIDNLAEELNLNLKSTGSVTCKRPDLLRGVEPDSSFYIQNEPVMRHKQNLDLTQDPPPDLVIEVDYTSASVDRMPIYLALGILEVWRYDEPVMQIYQLREGVYVPCNNSPTFADLPLTAEVPRFLAESLKIGEILMIRSFRDWVRQQIRIGQV
ncbi:Uma2 family endonuclease [Nostocaceae cyanobacterium CENA369]|uniref:Uma2 family endonuclease n=1 Tax=Dendronalium phyllosphericum CENA369 TaxID=1725256 RepID=A0A8J7I9T3_9NOST|nr:Uma2 family endonuclease [Dendronalium phyllosphericum]MBH8575067.1 Uma2 family endonuclease [Dendronalium phyllosphericum CENA369]